MFEEAIGVPVVADNHEDKLPVGFEDEVEGEVTGKLVDGAAVLEVIDEESVAEKDLGDRLNRMENDVAWEASNITASDIVNLEERPVNGHANKEAIQVDKESGTRDSDSWQEVDSGLNWKDFTSISSHDNVEGPKDNLVNLDPELKDDEIRELKEAAPVSPVLLYHNGKNEELKDMSNMDLESQDERSCELEYTSAATDSDHHRISLKPEDTQHMPLEGSKATLEQADKDAEASNVAAKEQLFMNGTLSLTQNQSIEDSANGESDGNDETREKLQMVWVKFPSLAHRLGQLGGNFSISPAQLWFLEVGKSATINSIFDEVKFCMDAFELGTKKIQDVVGTVQGIKGIDFGDMPLLRTITQIFGPSIWVNAIVVLTHATSPPPEGPNGTATSYDMFVTQRSLVVQQVILAGGWGLGSYESCFFSGESLGLQNRQGRAESITHWPGLEAPLVIALLCVAIIPLKLQDRSPGKAFATRIRAPPLPFLLSSLLQSRPLKLPEEQFGDDEGLVDDLDESSDSDNESEYDQFPSFKWLTKDQLAMLSRAQKKSYFDELELREKLFMKKQLKEEKKRRKMMKKHAVL
ncbi:multimeric translocon complex in the outer envelope membrane 132 [Actinidia rufa]|uniref:Multimeric translocon complex in the outer envelope membrane 132 n=1 Tax=Actinidia rufa TaxID=165716 RepID=A0A7J0D8C9_9ERIC|nr:multimeric translocon complex in the outer envelope membrane 132 [Actinidia rufa]